MSFWQHPNVLALKNSQEFLLRAGDAVHIYNNPKAITLQIRHEVQTKVDASATSFQASVRSDKAGAVWFQKKQISLPELSQAISNRFRVDTNLPVYISGDRDTLHGDMVKVYETARAVGIQKVSFMTESRQTPTPP